MHNFAPTVSKQNPGIDVKILHILAGFELELSQHGPNITHPQSQKLEILLACKLYQFDS